jgi:hypothetical protein
MFLGIASLALFLSSSNVALAALDFTASDHATSTVGVATLITDLQIVGPSASTTPLRLFVSNGTLAFGTTTGLTFTGPSSGASLSFSGTVENINTALATLTYLRGGAGTDTLEASIAGAGEVLFPDNGHIYKYILGSITASAARTAAASQTAGGISGYLATITNQAENDYISARLTGDGWFGASDEGTEGAWKWVTGPETGQTFWNGQSNGAVVPGFFENWAGGEPNDYSSGEDCAQFYSNGSGWNDLPCTGATLAGYVVEFGAPGSLPEAASKNVSIATVAAPAVSGLSPADNATGVSLTANLQVTFNMGFSTSTGVISVRRSSDDSVVESTDISSTKISKSGNTLTIDLDSTFDEGTSYYVNIASTTVRAVSDAIFYSGIANATSWNFTTLDITAPVISSLSGSSTSSTTAAFSWTTNELASTRVLYGLTTARTSSTSLTDVSPRTLSHEEDLSGLLSCSTYYYAVESTDGFTNTATSTAGTFVTPGCPASETPTIATSTSMSSNTGGSTTLAEGNSAITVSLPSNVTSTSSSVVIQVQALPASAILSSLGRPSQVPREVGAVIFDVKAIIDSNTVLESFDHPVTIDYTYSDGDVTGLDESTFWLYHYHDGAWDALDACDIDTGANTISCTTPNFSIFSLFGRPLTQVSANRTQSNPRKFGCKDPNASNYDYFVSHDQSLCAYVDASSTSAQTTAVATNAGVRDLTVGMSGDDVRMLQSLLMGKGYAIPAGATGYFASQTKAALSAYQKDTGVRPSIGYFGSITRAQMKGAGLQGLWW